MVDCCYYTYPKLIKVRNPYIVFLSYFFKLSIFITVVGLMVSNKGYQEFSPIQSAVNIKIRGTAYTNFTDDEFDYRVKKKDYYYYRRVWDVADYKKMENDAVFILTNVVITPGQKQSVCPEVIFVNNAACDPKNNTCVEGQPLHNGKMTGKCIKSTQTYKTNYSCEIRAWCPPQDIIRPLNNRAVLKESENFTILIKNFVSFTNFQVIRRNIIDTTNKTYLDNCLYGENDRRCANFRLGDIVKWAGKNYSEIAIKGAVIVVLIKWDCDFDWSDDYCFPTYSFHRLHGNESKHLSGWDFKTAQYYNDYTRTLYHHYGIKLIVEVQGRAGKFNAFRLFMGLGAFFGFLYIEKRTIDMILKCRFTDVVVEEPRRHR